MATAPKKPVGVMVSRIDGTFISTGDGSEHPTRVTRNTSRAVLAFQLENGAANPTGRIRYYIVYGARDGSYANTYIGKWQAVTAMTETRILYNLQQNTEYYFRIYCDGDGVSKDSKDPFIRSASALGYFVTNRPPNVPEAQFPNNDTQFAVGASFPLRVLPKDPDDDFDIKPKSDIQYVQFRVRRKATPSSPAGQWIAENIYGTGFGTNTAFETYNLGPQPQGGQAYEWQAAAVDNGGLWSDWTELRTYFLTSDVASPALLSPARAQGVSEAGPFVFRFRHQSPTGTPQDQVTIFYRVKGQEDWQTLIVVDGPATPEFNGETVVVFDPSVPGNEGKFVRGFQYEWTASTRTTEGKIGPKAEGMNFYVTAKPGSGTPPEPTLTSMAPALGYGHNRVFLYERGGQRLIGEITPLVKVRWSRVRDDISACTFRIEDFDKCRDLLADMRSWQHEIVVYRDNGYGPERVWEGPVTHVTYAKTYVEVEAKDVMVYVYRRVMRLGYNDSYQLIIPGIFNGSEFIYGWGQVGLRSVVQRAEQILVNALSYDDPNVIEHITSFSTGEDTRQSRIVNAYSKTAWQEVDDLAAKAGLDYTTAGRRIMVWDTHDQIGRLPEMTDSDFGEPPIVTEYGMQTATDFVVTNNNGVYGISTKAEGHPYYGYVEQLASAYSENEESGGSAEVLTQKARQELESTLTGQAQRNIASRYPTPLIVRVPDNTTLNPELNIGINQLIPGVWVPLRATGTLRTVAQMQKLDNMVCEETSKGEVITITLSPAPGTLGEDPDAGGTDVVTGE